MLSQDTGGKLISDIKDLFRFSPKTYLLGEEGEPDEFVESVSYDALERQAMEILEDLDRGKSRWTHVSRLYAREINPYDGDGKGLNRFTQFFDKIYDWIKEAGIVDGLQPGETILVVDESSSGTYPWILKYVIETRSLADLAKRLGKPESEIQPFRVIFQAGGRSNHDYFIENFPIFDYERVLGYGNFAVSAIADKGENMPHPVKFGSVGSILEEATGQVIFESEEPDVLLGAYLNSMFIYNEVVRFYNYLNGLVRKKNKTQKEWNLLLHYLTLKLPPEVEATPAALARASEFVLTERDIKMALVRKGILNELRDYAGAVYCLSDPVDLPSVLALQELMPEARIILNDSFVPGGSELVKDVPEPGDERAVRDFLEKKFGDIGKAHGFTQTVVSRGEAPGTYIVFLKKGKLSDFQRVEIEYRAGDFYQMEIPKGTGVVYLNLPERDGVSLENPGLWEKLGVGLQGPGYALVASRFDGDSFEAPGFSKLADGVEMGLFTNGVFQISRAEVRESPKSDFDRDFHRWIGNYWQELRRAYPDLPDSILKPTFYRMYKMVRDEIAPLIKEDDRILEIGVGSGVIISMLAEEVKKRGIHNVRFIGTDIDPDVARIARRMTQKYGNVEVLPAGDLFDPVLGMKFDWVIWNPPWFQEQLINGQEYGPKMVDPGYGVVRRFFREVPDYLTPSGRSAVIFPSKYFPKAASEFERDYVKVAGINPKFEIGIYISDLMRGKREGWSGDPKISRASAPKEHDPKRPQRERYKREKLNKRSEVRDEGLVKAEEPAVSASMSPESVRSEMNSQGMVEAGWRKFVGRADAVRRAWNVSEKKETGGKQGVEKPFASEAVVRSDALRSGHLCLVRGNFDKLTQGLRTALDAVRDEIPVFQRWDETDSLSSELKMLTELVRNISQHVRGKEGILAIQFDKDAKRLYVAAIDRGEGFSFLTKGARTQDAKEEFGISLRADGYFEQSGINRVGAGTGMRDVVRQSERVLIRSRDTEWSEEDLRLQGQGVIPGIERKDGLPGSLVCVSVNLEESMRIINRARQIREARKDARRTEIRWEEQSRKFLTELEERSELRKFVMSDGFSNAANIELGEFADPTPFVTSVRESLLNAMLPKAFAAETVDPVIAKIVPDKMKALNATLEQVKGRLTIALDLGTLSGAMGQFMEIPVEGTAPVNEIGVTGVLDGGTRDLLRTRGITVRTVEPKRNFISRNQTQVPYVTSNFSVETLSDIFDPILADQISTGDVSAQCYRDRFLIVAAIHLADIRRGGKAMSLSEIRDELLRRLNLKEKDALIHIRGRGFAVSSAAVETYLRMQAEKSIQKAA